MVTVSGAQARPPVSTPPVPPRRVPGRPPVERVGVAGEHGALPSRLTKHGEVIGRGTVRFDTESEVVKVRPHLLRVLDGPGS